MKVETLGAVLAEVEAKRPIVLATNLETGEQRLLHRGEGGTESERADVQLALRIDTGITSDAEGDPQVFYRPFNPPLRMILIGAVHIAQPLSAMATLAGYAVTLVDPRASFAAADRFPGVTLSLEWPDVALKALSLEQRCAVVTLSHDPKLDDVALQVALRSDAFFIGCLGSKKTHASRLRRLGKAGFSEAELARVKGPVGLPIGSRSPAEIAVSVLAQVTETLRKPRRMRRNLSSPKGARKNIVAVVLAAGASRRMSQANKLTIPVDGTPMVASVVDALQESGVTKVLVVTGHAQEEIRGALGDRDVEIVHNPDHEEGMGASVRTGVSAVGDDVDGVLIALGDMPWVDTDVIGRLLDAFSPDGDLSIYIPMFGRKRGNPVLWGSRHFPELRQLSGDVGGKALFHTHAEAICYVDVESAAVNIDVDTPEALHELGIDGSDD